MYVYIYIYTHTHTYVLHMIQNSCTNYDRLTKVIKQNKYRVAQKNCRPKENNTTALF